MIGVRQALLLGLAGFLFATPALAARDASFLAPSAPVSSSGPRSDGAVAIEPKSDVDLGETGQNVAKRTTLFFVNTTNLPIDILGITANGDSNVEAQIVSDDCSKEGKIDSASRCAVSVEVTPKGTGVWTAEVLMTHNGAGRLARAKLSGKTAGTSGDKKEQGLALSTKDIKPIDFGSVDVGAGKAVRSALMVNDSNEPITLLSIEVIAAENGLERLEQQGCMLDMELKPGESCPVTMLWKPERTGMVSTDLILRHTGRTGFAVIPVRGTAKEVKIADAVGGASGVAGKKGATPSGKDAIVPQTGSAGIALSPTAEDMEKLVAGSIPDVSAEELSAAKKKASASAAEDEKGDGEIHLIGTVGNRGVFYLGDGTTVVAGTGEEIGAGKTAVKVLAVAAKQAEVSIGEKKKTLVLETVAALTAKAAQKRQERASSAKQSSGSSSNKKGAAPKPDKADK